MFLPIAELIYGPKILDPTATPKAYRVLPLLGLGAATMMIFTRDGHGPGLLSGALLAALMIRITKKTR